MKDLQRVVEDLIVQLDLGRKEAVDQVEQAKANLCSLVERMEQSGSQIAKPLRQSLGNLGLQLKLGKMESRDAYYEQRDRLEESIRQVEQSFREHRHDAGEEFADATRSLIDRIHLLGFQIEETEKKAGREIEAARQQVREKLVDLSGRMREEIASIEEKARSSASECRSALAGISSNLRSLFKHK